MIDTATELLVPRGEPGQTPFKLDLAEVNNVEVRKNEVAYVNKETAPELMQVFNSAYCSVLRMMTRVSYEYTQAVKHVNKRKAIVMLDEAPRILKEKGLISARSPSGSEDLRKAVLDCDEEYLALVDKVNMLEAVYELLKGKAKGFEMSYQSVKKIYDVQNSGLGSGVGYLHAPPADVDNGLDSVSVGIPRY